MILEKLQNKQIFTEEMHDKFSKIIDQYSKLEDDEKWRFNQAVKDIFNKTVKNLIERKSNQIKWLTWFTDNRITFVLAILIINFLFGTT